ncbi:hypothetical protein [Burkholderia sp. PU8-34]
MLPLGTNFDGLDRNGVTGHDGAPAPFRGLPDTSTRANPMIRHTISKIDENVPQFETTRQKSLNLGQKCCVTRAGGTNCATATEIAERHNAGRHSAGAENPGHRPDRQSVGGGPLQAARRASAWAARMLAHSGAVLRTFDAEALT